MFGAGNYNTAGAKWRDSDFLTVADAITAATAVTWGGADTNADGCGGRS